MCLKMFVFTVYAYKYVFLLPIFVGVYSSSFSYAATITSTHIPTVMLCRSNAEPYYRQCLHNMNRVQGYMDG